MILFIVNIQNESIHASRRIFYGVLVGRKIGNFIGFL